MARKVIHTDHAPKAMGPYSQGILAEGKFVFVSGQVGIDPTIGKIVDGGFEAQAKQVLENIKAILAAAGAGLSDVVKVTVLLKDINEFSKLNAIYATYFTENPPARMTFGGIDLPGGALVEIECIALVQS